MFANNKNKILLNIIYLKAFIYFLFPIKQKNINFFYMESFSDQFKVRSGIEENLHICGMFIL